MRPLTCVSLYVPTSCMRPAIHENLRKKVQAVSVQYDQDKKILIVLVSSGRSCARVEFIVNLQTVTMAYIYTCTCT